MGSVTQHTSKIYFLHCSITVKQLLLLSRARDTAHFGDTHKFSVLLYISEECSSCLEREEDIIRLALKIFGEYTHFI